MLAVAADKIATLITIWYKSNIRAHLQGKLKIIPAHNSFRDPQTLSTAYKILLQFNPTNAHNFIKTQ
jgi:hypothetical protein